MNAFVRRTPRAVEVVRALVLVGSSAATGCASIVVPFTDGQVASDAPARDATRDSTVVVRDVPVPSDVTDAGCALTHSCNGATMQCSVVPGCQHFECQTLQQGCYCTTSGCMCGCPGGPLPPPELGAIGLDSRPVT